MRTKITYGRVGISNIKVAVDDYKKKHYLAMKRLMRDAAGVFVESAVDHVHVDTGMSAASLEPFANAAKTTILDKFIAKRVRKGLTSLPGRYYKNRIKGISEGIRAGKNAYKFNYGTYQNPKMSFTFQIKVWQYWYWEPNWQSLNEAVIDSEIFIEGNYSKYIPSLKKKFKFFSGVSY